MPSPKRAGHGPYPDDESGEESFFCTLCLDAYDGKPISRGAVVTGLAHVSEHFPDGDLRLVPRVDLV